jgi:hypothetical protein
MWREKNMSNRNRRDEENESVVGDVVETGIDVAELGSDILEGLSDLAGGIIDVLAAIIPE